MGRLTRDVDVRATGKGNVASFTVAVNKSFKNAAGERQEYTSFFECAAFGATGQVIAQNFSKGRPIFVDGELKQERWMTDGVKHARIKVIVNQFQFIDRKDESPSQPPQNIEDELPFS